MGLSVWLPQLRHNRSAELVPWLIRICSWGSLLVDGTWVLLGPAVSAETVGLEGLSSDCVFDLEADVPLAPLDPNDSRANCASLCLLVDAPYLGVPKMGQPSTTCCSGCLGSHLDEERSEMRYAVRIAGPRESSEC